VAGVAGAWPAGPVLSYAGFWLRFVAYIIDGFVVATGFITIIIVLAMVTGIGSAVSGIHSGEDIGQALAVMGITFIFFAVLLGILGGWLYFAMMESSVWQATLGKKALGLEVTDLIGRRISFARASGRHFGKIITNLIPLFIGYILAGFTEKKQAVHDMIAGCLVLRKAA
jgi:uncharacterized RDD family membrane protein YckC